MTTAGRLASIAGVVLALAVPAARTSLARPSAVADAINELDVDRARVLLDAEQSTSIDVTFLRARLAVYLGDCDAAEAMLEPLRTAPQTLDLLGVARACARAVAGAGIVVDHERGIWVRLQDDEDRSLLPYIAAVAAQARDASERALGTTLPRPLKIDLVRDLFSLAAVSGLPLAAAETTGTVAVARWGRVTMVSPRAARFGFPWEDTLAHEIAHLVLSRATRDGAPLWLQEGVAKRQEAAWRPERPFDGNPGCDATARHALETGTSVGITNLGKSIAMLPTPEAAGIAYAEVESFVGYWIRENGASAFHLLLRDLKGIGEHGTDGAMKSVSGYGLEDWIIRWVAWLASDKPANGAAVTTVQRPAGERTALRHLRLGDLAFDQRAFDVSFDHYRAALGQATDDAIVRYRHARAELALGRLVEAERSLGKLEELASLNARWLALSGYVAKRRSAPDAAERSFQLALGLDPYSVEVACEGYDPKWAPTAPAAAPSPDQLPADRSRLELCQTALRIPRD